MILEKFNLNYMRYPNFDPLMTKPQGKEAYPISLCLLIIIKAS